MIRATVTGDMAAQDRLRSLRDRAPGILARETARQADRARDIADDNLSGSVLNARSGALRASLQTQAGGMTAIVTATTPYAAFQEYGFAGTETVRDYLRAGMSKTVTVRAHQRQVDSPSHSFLRAALSDAAPGIRDALRMALNEVAR